MKPLNANQIRHLRHVIENPGVVPSGCNYTGFNHLSFQALRKRDLITSPAGINALAEKAVR